MSNSQSVNGTMMLKSAALAMLIAAAVRYASLAMTPAGATIDSWQSFLMTLTAAVALYLVAHLIAHLD